jgi:hypothetical protein
MSVKAGQAQTSSRATAKAPTGAFCRYALLVKAVDDAA